MVLQAIAFFYSEPVLFLRLISVLFLKTGCWGLRDYRVDGRIAYFSNDSRLKVNFMTLLVP